MRVCIAIQSFSPVVGGAQLQLERLLPELAAQGVEAVVLTKRHEERPDREVVGGAQVRRIGLRGASPAASTAFVLGTIAHLARNPRRYDLVHAFGALSEGAFALGATALGLPALVRVLRSGELGDFDRLGTKPAGQARIRALVGRASFVALSKEGVDELTALGIPPNRLFAIPNGVDLAVYRPPSATARAVARTELGFPSDSFLVVYTGRLRPEKQLDLLVRAIATLPRAVLALVGEGPEQSRLATLAHELGASDRIRLEGRQEGVERYLRAADVFALPSRSEGMSNSLLEAMACGLACVATPVSGVAELLGADRGLIVPSGDGDALREALSRLSDNDADRRALGNRAAVLIRERYSLARTADLTVEAYRTLVASG